MHSYTPAPDPLLTAQEQQAKQADITTIQGQVAAMTRNLIQVYGAKASLGGGAAPGATGTGASPATASAGGGLQLPPILGFTGAQRSPLPGLSLAGR